jgi:hypothetical protein
MRLGDAKLIEAVMTTEEKLKEYSDLLGLYQAMTLDDLIASHQAIRSDNIKFHTEIRQIREEAVKRGYELGKSIALEQDYISRERLMKMTVQELVDLLGD